MKQSVNIMLQKWINPLKVPVPFTLSHSWTSQRSMIWSWVNMRTRINKPWNWSTCCCVNSLFSRDISWNHRSSTGFSRIKCECASQFLTRALFYGVPLTRQQTTTAGSTRGGVLYLTERIHRVLLKVSHGWLPIASHWLGRQWNPLFLCTLTQEPAVPWCSEHYLGSAVW